MKNGKIGVGMIKGAIIALIFLTVLLNILPSLIHQNAVSVGALATEYGNATVYGSSASSIGSQIDDWTSYFWVLGPLILIITVILGIFMGKR